MNKTRRTMKEKYWRLNCLEGLFKCIVKHSIYYEKSFQLQSKK